MRKNIFLLMMIATTLVTTVVNAFDNSNFKGSYAFRLVGPSSIVLANQPRTVGTGIYIADGKGHVTGHGTFRSAGATCNGNIDGVYTVNTNGTGILSSKFLTSTPGCFNTVLDFAIALADKGETFDLANNENDYMIGKLTRQNQKSYKLSDFKGSYALNLEGPSSLVRASQPLTVGNGVITADGNGKITGTGSLRSSGATCHGTFIGNYQLAADGTGNIYTNFLTSDPGCFTTVIDLSLVLFKKANGGEIANTENDYMQGSLNRQI